MNLTPAEKAAEILSLWGDVEKVLHHRPAAWLRLLRLVQAGSQGLTLQQLFNGRGTGHWRWLTSLVKAGLIEIQEDAVHHPRGGRPASIVRITPAGIRALSLEPAKPAPKDRVHLIEVEGCHLHQMHAPEIGDPLMGGRICHLECRWQTADEVKWLVDVSRPEPILSSPLRKIGDDLGFLRS